MKLPTISAVQDRCLRVYFPTIGNNLQHLIQPVNTFADLFCNEFHGWVGGVYQDYLWVAEAIGEPSPTNLSEYFIMPVGAPFA